MLPSLRSGLFTFSALATTALVACGDGVTATRTAPDEPLRTTTCGSAHHVNFTYYKDASLSTSGTNSMYTGELRWVDIAVRDYNGCRLPASRISSVGVNDSTRVGIQLSSSLNPVYRLQALKSHLSGAQLKVVADGITFTSNISLFDPTVRIFRRDGTEITSTLPVEVDIWTDVMAKAYAGSSGPVIPTAGWPSQPVWSTGSSAATVVNGGTAGGEAALASIKGVTVGSTTLSVQMLGVTKSVPVSVQARAAVATVEVTGPKYTLVTTESVTYTATVRDASGNVLSGRTVTWSTDNTAVATVTSAGRLTAVAAGSVNLRATVEGVIGTRAISVTGPPALNMNVTYPGGVPTIQWQSYPEATRYEVYRIYEEEIDDYELGYSSKRVPYLVYSGTSLSATDPDGYTYTGVSDCRYDDGLRSEYYAWYYEVVAVTTYTGPGQPKEIRAAMIAQC